MANAAEQMPIVVGGFTVDLDCQTLSGSNGEIRLRPKTFAVLRYLLMHRGRVVTKQALIDAVWGDTSVTDDSLVQCLIEIRRALGDKRHRLIKTGPRRAARRRVEIGADPLKGGMPEHVLDVMHRPSRFQAGRASLVPPIVKVQVYREVREFSPTLMGR